MDYYGKALPLAGVTVRLNEEASVDMVKKEAPDAVVLAAGSVPAFPGFCRVPGAMTAADALHGAETGDNPLILGGGLIGAETADFLSEKGKKVTLLEMLPDIAKDMEGRTRRYLMLRLKERAVTILTGTQVLEITAERAVRAPRHGGSPYARSSLVRAVRRGTFPPHVSPAGRRGACKKDDCRHALFSPLPAVRARCRPFSDLVPSGVHHPEHGARHVGREPVCAVAVLHAAGAGQYFRLLRHGRGMVPLFFRFAKSGAAPCGGGRRSCLRRTGKAVCPLSASCRKKTRASPGNGQSTGPAGKKRRRTEQFGSEQKSPERNASGL